MVETRRKRVNSGRKKEWRRESSEGRDERTWGKVRMEIFILVLSRGLWVFLKSCERGGNGYGWTDGRDREIGNNIILIILMLESPMLYASQ